MRSKALLLGAAVLLLAGGTLACKKNATKGAEEKPASGKKVLYWYDPMKPEVHFDHPGKSPFMDMQLEPKYAEEAPAPAASAQKKVLYWYDPMKPEVHFDHPGKSPFMDMQLEPKYAEEPPAAGASAPAGLSVVRIPLERRQEIGVTTAKVQKRTIGESIETNGVVAEDEGRLNAVNAKFAGY